MTDFASLGLSPEILQAVVDSGYTTPTPIQEQAIPVALAGRDVLGIAQTGTGKTAAFTLPMIERLAAGRARARMPRSLVIEPTRELADQVAASFDKYAKGQKLSWALLIGGVSFDEQEKKLDRGVDVLIATPGRLLDHFERGKLLLTGVQIMVVDEADRMLDMGFIPDIERIFKLTPPNRQTLFFSATMPPEITRLTAQFLKDPTRIEVDRPATTADTITQRIARIPTADPKAKRTALRTLIAGADVKNAIVFCNRKSEVDIVAKSLARHGVDAAPIHGDLDQSTRTRTLENFRKGDLRILVASDVAARGLDVPAVSHIFNYDVPHHAEDYVHRIGRTGRAGRLGQAFMIVTPADTRNYDKVIKLTKKEPEFVTLDIDWSQIEPDDRERRPPRGGAAPRGERGRSAPRPAAPASPERAAEELAVIEAGEPTRGPRSRNRRAGRSGQARDTNALLGAETPEFEMARSVEPAALARPRVPEPDVSDVQGPRERAPRGRPDYGRPEYGSGPARRSAQQDPADAAVVGFGAETPAFLTRPAGPDVRSPKAGLEE